MKAIVTGDLLILVPDTADEKAALAHWRYGRDANALATVRTSGAGTSIQFLGPREGDSVATRANDMEGQGEPV
jgi:hypothetical protein